MSITKGLSLFKHDPLLWKPGTKYRYSSFSFILLGEIIQKAAQIPFNTLVSNSIFKPLKMNHSEMELSDTDKPIDNLTTFYKLNLMRKPVKSKSVANEYKISAGGFLSTSEDMIKFGNEIINPQIISKPTLKILTTSQHLSNGYKTGYGIGFSVRHSVYNTPKYFHTGGGVGASNILCIYPEEGVVISILTNLTGIKITDFAKDLEAFFLKNE